MVWCTSSPCYDFLEIKCLLVWLLHNTLVYSANTLAALSSHDADVKRRFVALNWVSVCGWIVDVDTDLLLLVQYMMDCKSSNPLSTVLRWVPPYHNCHDKAVAVVSKSIDFLPLGGNYLHDAGNCPSFFCCTRSYLELRRGAWEDNIVPAPPLSSRQRVRPFRQANRDDNDGNGDNKDNDNDNDDDDENDNNDNNDDNNNVGGIQGSSRQWQCCHCYPRTRSIHGGRDSECSHIRQPPAMLQPPRQTRLFVGDWLPRASRHQKLHHDPYYIDILRNHLGMFNLGIISTFFTLRSYFINLEWLSSTSYIQVSH